MKKVLTSIIFFFVAYAGLVAAVWGFTEAYTYFTCDNLREFLGTFWWVLFYGVPLIMASLALVFRPSKKPKELRFKKISSRDRGFQVTYEFINEGSHVENVILVPHGNFSITINPRDSIAKGQRGKIIFESPDPRKPLDNELKFQVNYLDKDGVDGFLKLSFRPHDGRDFLKFFERV